jgi:hypothetical protein
MILDILEGREQEKDLIENRYQVEVAQKDIDFSNNVENLEIDKNISAQVGQGRNDISTPKNEEEYSKLVIEEKNQGQDSLKQNLAGNDKFKLIIPKNLDNIYISH